MAQKLTYWLLVALVLSLGFGQLLRFEIFSLPIYLHDLLVLSILLLQGQALKVLTLKYSYTIFLFALLLSSARALTLYPLSSLLIPSLYLLRLLAYLSLYLILKTRQITIPSKIFILSGLLTVGIGLAQYWLLPDMRWAQYLGWDDHLSRLTLPHFDPTFTAVMIGLFLLYIIKSHFPYTILHTLYAIPAILLTYSRSVWLSLIATAMLFIKNKLILLLAICFMFVAIIALPQKFGEGTNLLRTYSISSRFTADLQYLQKYQWDLFIGRGLNTLILDSGPSLYDNHATGPNNSYLYLLITTGILGLLGWGTFMFSLYRHSPYKPMLIFFFIVSLFNNVMFYPFALLWVLLVEAMVPTGA